MRVFPPLDLAHVQAVIHQASDVSCIAFQVLRAFGKNCITTDRRVSAKNSGPTQNWRE